MKKTVLIALLFASLNCSAQNVIIDSCGVDNRSTLSEFEADYFEAAFGNDIQAVDFNFQGKKILFRSGNHGVAEISKSNFFKENAKPWFDKDDFPSLQIIRLTEEERVEMNNYDAIVVSWSKIGVTERNRKKFIRNAKRKNT